MTRYDVKRDGTTVDDVLIADLAAEAERGYTADQLQGRPRGRGRPPLGDKVKAVGSVRLDAELRAQARARAADDGVTVSEVVRRALRSTCAAPEMVRRPPGREASAELGRQPGAQAAIASTSNVGWATSCQPLLRTSLRAAYVLA